MRWLAKLIYFKLLGWKVAGNTNFSKDFIKKAVIITAPHTSKNQVQAITKGSSLILVLRCKALYYLTTDTL